LVFYKLCSMELGHFVKDFKDWFCRQLISISSTSAFYSC
jgi:hypothetical protein